MEIREPRSNPSSPALDWPTNSYSVAAKSLQLLAEDITNISAANFERNAKLIDDLRGARTVEDLVSIQTKFMAGMFEAFNDHVRLMGSRMAELRSGLIDDKASPVAVAAPPPSAPNGLHQVVEATKAATRANIEATKAATRANIDAGQKLTKSAFEAAEKAADTIRSELLPDDEPPAETEGE